MAKYIKAEAGPGNSVIYTDTSGKQWQFEGGNRPWRNQNPGNLVPGKVSKRNGAIGKAGGFAVFPDYETGWGKSGTLSEYSPKGKITGVRKDKKGTIQSYQIEGYGWVSKAEGIALALGGKVEAVIAASPKGNQFLRARPNTETLDNLEELG
jgi:hypothetical protein